MYFSIQIFAEENSCEKTWDIYKNKVGVVRVDKGNAPCKQIWEDVNKAKLVKMIGLNPRDAQWMSTGECHILDIENNRYQVYYAYFKNDLSDIRIISDANGNYFSYFRNLGRYDMFEDKFYPTKKSNKNGVELNCPGIGDFEKLKPVLSSYINNKGIDMRVFTFEDLDK